MERHQNLLPSCSSFTTSQLPASGEHIPSCTLHVASILHVHVLQSVQLQTVHVRQLIFLRKSGCGCVALPSCLFDLGCFFLLSLVSH